jgi:hypothetical protein
MVCKSLHNQPRVDVTAAGMYYHDNNATYQNGAGKVENEKAEMRRRCAVVQAGMNLKAAARNTVTISAL